MFLRFSTVAVMVLVGAGCVNGGVDEPQAGSVQQGILGCPVFMCGTNSPQIAERKLAAMAQAARALRDVGAGVDRAERAT
jgi:hypothetical protein